MELIGRIIVSPAFRLHLQYQARFAGHAKWQNIRHTKTAHDVMKSKLINRYVLMVRRAVIQGGRQSDPKINTKLGDVMSQAFKMNVPRATLERAIDRAMQVKVEEKLLEIQGPGGCAIVCKCETENVAVLRRDVKKALKKLDAAIVGEGKLMNMFEEKGYVRAKSKDKNGKEIDADAAEEAAIEAGAEEVINEDYGSLQEGEGGDSKIWVFITCGEQLYACKSRLETKHFDIVSADVEIRPYRKVDFGEKVYSQLQEVVASLSELAEVSEIFHNVSEPEAPAETSAVFKN